MQLTTLVIVRPSSEFAALEYIPRLTHAILLPSTLLNMIVKIIYIDSALWRQELRAIGRSPDNAHTIRWRLLGGFG